ncbi:hypothetical protein GCM10010405_53770 [Streptomyces macrosporus]|uniref:Insertion element IS402-like domain-containing protein n=1 Tax=Streptomyces macrosporus TaxID=44032 RepID=A0ABN3KMT8_9ACTN
MGSLFRLWAGRSDEWTRLEPHLPKLGGRGGRGGQWSDHRQVIHGILFRVRTGVPWRDLPERFGNWKTVYERHRRWSADGTWDRAVSNLMQRVVTDPAVAGKHCWSWPTCAAHLQPARRGLPEWYCHRLPPPP